MISRQMEVETREWQREMVVVVVEQEEEEEEEGGRRLLIDMLHRLVALRAQLSSTRLSSENKTGIDGKMDGKFPSLIPILHIMTFSLRSRSH